MAAAYSIDLRKKILSAWQGKEDSQRGLAKRFKVSYSFIKDLFVPTSRANEVRKLWLMIS